VAQAFDNRKFGALFGLFRKASRETAVQEVPSVRRISLRQRHKLVGVWYAVPGLFLLVLFRFWPLFFGLFISLFRWGFVRGEYLGFGNYVTMFTEDFLRSGAGHGLEVGQFLQSLLVTIYYTLGTIPVSITVAFVIAYLLFFRFRERGRSALRTIFFLPYITSQVAAMMVFKWLFHPQVGLVNAGLGALGFPAQSWFIDAQPIAAKILSAVGGAWPQAVPTAFGGPSLALIVIIAFWIWHTVGFNVVIFLAGFSGISTTLIDAARVDGAGTWARIRYIVLPLLSPMIFFLSVVSVIMSFESFNAFYVFSDGQGSPLGTTMSLPLYIFRNFYDYGRAGYASAMSVVLFLILLALTLIQRRVAEQRVHYELDR
jgi:ABC-type sugar transport system permease subunit